MQPMMKEKKAKIQGEGEGKTVLNVSDYPELEGIQAGASVKGTWEGTVDSEPDKDGNVPITYNSMELETENAADKALEGMMAKPEAAGEEEEI